MDLLICAHTGRREIRGFGRMHMTSNDFHLPCRSNRCGWLHNRDRQIDVKENLCIAQILKIPFILFNAGII
jgi:hypothetical protein